MLVGQSAESWARATEERRIVSARVGVTVSRFDDTGMGSRLGAGVGMDVGSSMGSGVGAGMGALARSKLGLGKETATALEAAPAATKVTV